jgi:DNA-binding GntR family transcriptional regulator
VLLILTRNTQDQAILTAFENSDEVAAEIAIRKHLGKSLSIVDGIKDHYPNYFL